MPEIGTSGTTAGSAGRRRRRGALLVPLVGVGIAAWAARRHLTERRGPADGWHTLPPAPSWPVARTGQPPAPVGVEDAVTEEMAVPAPPVAVPPVAMPPVAAAPAAGTASAPARAVPAAAAAPVAVAAVAAPTLPDVPGALPALAGGSSPDPAYTVKAKVATKTFHVPGGPYFTRTRADVWFRTADDARAAGFTERVRRS
jgi:hypothetical protein